MLEHDGVVVVLAPPRCFQSEPQAGVPGGVGWNSIGRPLRHDLADVGAADEAERAVVEVVADEIGDHRAAGARAHERVDVDVLVEEHAARALVVW